MAILHPFFRQQLIRGSYVRANPLDALAQKKAPRKAEFWRPRTQMGPHILEDSTHKIEGQPPQKGVDR